MAVGKTMIILLQHFIQKHAESVKQKHHVRNQGTTDTLMQQNVYKIRLGSYEV